ncbi:MAG: ATP-binding protein [Woeseia sp.]|nr:ATP-binding protein [Woeseia sp.]MBT8097996.1 ATP-binding protein [Woeseia sp.]NNE61987.1 ATP-binding protein [Woeseia sp.]NNL55131.1 ATP-binding protein [Woeseia sp.]
MQRKFSRNLDEIANIVALTEEFFAREKLDPTLRPIVDLCVEELFVNMVTYNLETAEDILIEMKARHPGIEVSLTDFDVERFDPSELAPVDINAPLENREPGGLGLFLVMKMADSIHYEYRDRVSRITFFADRKTDDV